MNRGGQLRASLWRERGRQVAGIALRLAMVVVPLLALMALAGYGFLANISDWQDAPLYHGNGKVISIFLPYGAERRYPPSTSAWVQIGNKSALVRFAEPARIGQKVRADYRIGRTGRLYIDHAELVGPLP